MTDERDAKVGEVAMENGCPVLHGYDPNDFDTVQSPWGWLSAARQEVPLFWIPELNEWVVTRHSTLEKIMSDAVNFSSDAFNVPRPPEEIIDQVPEGRWAMELSNPGLKDPPEHTRIRRLFAPAFSLRQAALLADDMDDFTNELVDGFIDEGEIDLVHAYCTKIPVAMIARIIGAPQEDAPQLFKWAIQFLDAFGDREFSHEEIVELGESQLAWEKYITDLVRDREKNPRGEKDFITKLLTTSVDGMKLTEREIVGLVITAVFAGSDTAASCMGQLIHVLLSDDRRRWEELLADTSQLDLYVEEGLRFCNPVRGTLRVVLNDIEIDGIQLKKGQAVRTHTAAATRDESVFPEPNTYDPFRPNVGEHLSFGKGPHVCPGSNLAKREIKTAIETLLKRLPSMRSVPGHKPEFSISQFVPELKRGVVVEWDERSAAA